MEPFTLAQLAMARGRAYRLFGRFYLYGVTAKSLPLLQTIPELASHLVDTLDEMAADHYHLFGLNLFPYQTIFLEPAGLLGGETTELVAAFYQSAGYTPETADTFPDHVGLELDFLGFLCLAEASAWQSHQPSVAQQKRHQQIVFLCNYVTRWIQPWLIALDRLSLPLYKALGQLTADLLNHHLIELTQEYQDMTAFVLPPPPDLLENEETNLRQIGHYLLMPAYSGLFLSKQDIDILARQLKLPRGFGGRDDQLYNLMQTAVQYEEFEALVNALQVIVAEWQTAYAEMVEWGPMWEKETAVWQDRLTHTQNFLSRITKAVKNSR